MALEGNQREESSDERLVESATSALDGTKTHILDLEETPMKPRPDGLLALDVLIMCCSMLDLVAQTHLAS